MWLDISPFQPCPCGLVYAGGARFDNRAPVELELETWYHIGFTRAGDGKMLFYIDGKEAGTATSGAGAVTVVPGTKDWMLGLANIRGELLPIVDLQRYIGGAPV